MKHLKKFVTIILLIIVILGTLTGCDLFEKEKTKEKQNAKDTYSSIESVNDKLSDIYLEDKYDTYNIDKKRKYVNKHFRSLKNKIMSKI